MATLEQETELFGTKDTRRIREAIIYESIVGDLFQYWKNVRLQMANYFSYNLFEIINTEYDDGGY